MMSHFCHAAVQTEVAALKVLDGMASEGCVVLGIIIPTRASDTPCGVDSPCSLGKDSRTQLPVMPLGICPFGEVAALK